jgi:hypothetical protein
MSHCFLTRVTTSALALSVCAICAPALAQQNFVTVPNIAVPSGLHTTSFMPTATTLGPSSPPKGMASPFSHPGSPGSGLVRGRRYPGDLEYHGGTTLANTVHHTIFVNSSPACPPNACFGDPIGFLSDLNNSGMIHVTDQYVGTTASNRYPVGTNYLVNWTPFFGGTTFTDFDIAFLSYEVAAITNGLGPGHVYHVFLVPGQDLCFDTTYSVCYSPDKLSTFVFCAYHSSASDNLGNSVLYTAEPFQDVGGCSAQPGTPNGQLTDSTNNILSHEVFETLTDPFGDAWWNSLDNGIYGEEIGDECSFLFFTSTNVYFGPNFVRLNGKPYAVQPEYVNSKHACNTNVGD